MGTCAPLVCDETLAGCVVMECMNCVGGVAVCGWGCLWVGVLLSSCRLQPTLGCARIPHAGRAPVVAWSDGQCIKGG